MLRWSSDPLIPFAVCGRPIQGAQSETHHLRYLMQYHTLHDPNTKTAIVCFTDAEIGL